MGCAVSGVIVGNPQINGSSTESNTEYRYDDKRPRKGAERILSIGGESHQEEQQNWKENIEMFFYRERPSMIPNSVPIILNKENFMEIVGRRRKGAKDDTREHTCKKQEEVESRIDFQATADEKTP